MLNTREVAYLAPTKGFPQPSPDMATTFVPFGYTLPPLPIPPFLLTQNLSPNDIARYDIMNQKVSQRIYVSLVGKGQLS